MPAPAAAEIRLYRLLVADHTLGLKSGEIVRAIAGDTVGPHPQLVVVNSDGEEVGRIYRSCAVPA